MIVSVLANSVFVSMAADTAIALMESLGLVDDGESEDDGSSDSD